MTESGNPNPGGDQPSEDDDDVVDGVHESDEVAAGGGLPDDPSGTRVLPPEPVRDLDAPLVGAPSPGGTARMEAQPADAAGGAADQAAAGDAPNAGAPPAGGEGGGNNEPPKPEAPANGGGDPKRSQLVALLDIAIEESKGLAEGAKRAEELNAMVLEMTELLSFAVLPITDDDLEAIKARVIVLTGNVGGPARRLKAVVESDTHSKGRGAIERFKRARGMN